MILGVFVQSFVELMPERFESNTHTPKKDAGKVYDIDILILLGE